MDSTKEIEKVKAKVRIKEKNVRDSQLSRTAGSWWPERTWNQGSPIPCELRWLRAVGQSDGQGDWPVQMLTQTPK